MYFVVLLKVSEFISSCPLSFLHSYRVLPWSYSTQWFHISRCSAFSLVFCVWVITGNFQSIKISYYLRATKHKNLWLVYSTHTHTHTQTNPHTSTSTLQAYTDRETDTQQWAWSSSCSTSCALGGVALCLFVPVIFP